MIEYLWERVRIRTDAQLVPCWPDMTQVLLDGRSPAYRAPERLVTETGHQESREKYLQKALRSIRSAEALRHSSGPRSFIMIHSPIDTEELHALSDALLRLKSRDEIERFLGDLCTPSELQAMAQRFAVARMLSRGCRGAEIIRETGSSTATIARVNRSLRYGNKGYALAFDREEKEKENSHTTPQQAAGRESRSKAPGT